MNKALTDIVRKAANANGINEAVLLAIVSVESSGTPLWNVGGVMLPAIRFEGHYFHQRLTGSKLEEAIKQGLANPKAGAVKNPRSYADRYALLDRAKKIDANAAMESVSWGAGQVMGANWKSLGYNSVSDLVKASYDVYGQVDMIVRFLKVNNLIAPANALNWDKVAARYNGKNYKAGKYHIKLAEAYALYSGMPTSDYASEDIAGVMLVQTMLNKLGTYNLTVDGDFGDKTKAALMDFQLKNGLVADGIYGPITKEELEKDYKEALNKGEDILGKIGAGAGAAGTAATEAAKQLEPLAGASQWIQYLFIGLTIVGIVLTLKATIFKG